MQDADLAGLYRTTAKRLNEQVKRNRGRFPEDFNSMVIKFIRLHKDDKVVLP
jgi:hypothetical protein